jgi:hypothetical protein
MAQKDAKTIRAELAQPFAPEDLEWRLQRADKDGKWGIAVPFVTNRAIQNRLDDVVGPENWYNDFKPWHGDGKKAAQICGISIYFAEHQGFITKWDGAEDSDIEPVKGGLSDSMKRAAVQWGIGRVLYNMNAVFVDVEKKGSSWIIQDGQQSKLDNAYLGMLAKLGLAPASAGGIRPQTPPPVPDSPPQSKKQLSPPAPAYEYIIRTIEVQRGMNSTSTSMVLESIDKKAITAFARGEHPDLTPGAMLANVKLATRRQDTVVFHVLEAYQVISPQQRAA